MRLKHILIFPLALIMGLQAPLALAAELIAKTYSASLPATSEEDWKAQEQAIQQQNDLLGLQEYSVAATYQMPELKPSVILEADYIVASQHLYAVSLAYGAINNVYGSPTWVVPRENALAMLALIEAAEITGDAKYLTRASAARYYLARVQDASDGAWYDQYDYVTPVVLSKSPTQTAEVMIAYHKLGFDAAYYTSMKKGAQYLLALQNPANKTGLDDGLVSGGKDASGNYSTWRWASDNSFAYLALKAAQHWAVAYGDAAFASQLQAAAARIITGINVYLYNWDPNDDDFGVWKRAIDANGVEQEPWFHEWINYAPQMLDLPVIGANSTIIGDWIHRKFQQTDGSVVWNDTWHTTRKSPGFSFQAALVWQDLGQTAYADAAIQWAVNSGLWQKTPDERGVAGGWIDWVEPNETAPYWQRFIDTSFYSTAVFKGGYNFNILDPTPVDGLLMQLQNSSQARADFNLLFGTSISALGNVSSSNRAILFQVTTGSGYNVFGFLSSLTKAASLYRALQANATYRMDFNLLYAASLQSTGAPNATNRTWMFNVSGDPNYNQATYLPVLSKAASLIRALRTNSSGIADFNQIYGTTLSTTTTINAGVRIWAFSITGDPAYNQTSYVTVLTKAAALYRALQANAANRADFNLMFTVSLLATGIPNNTAGRAALFNVTGDPKYNQTTFLSVLTKAASLYRALQANSTYRADFNLLFKTTIASTGYPNPTSRTELFNVAGGSAYNQTAFLGVLRKSSSLYQKLRLDAAKRTRFNSRYGTSIPATGSPTVNDRTFLFNLTGSPTYNESIFWATL